MRLRFVKWFVVMLFALSPLVFQAGCGEDDPAPNDPDKIYGDPSKELDPPPADPTNPG